MAPMRSRPRKCAPITKMPIPAAMDSQWLHSRSRAPNTEAVAPSETKTVEKPATNSSEATKISRRVRGSPSSTSASTVVPAR